MSIYLFIKIFYSYLPIHSNNITKLQTTNNILFLDNKTLRNKNITLDIQEFRPKLILTHFFSNFLLKTKYLNLLIFVTQINTILKHVVLHSIVKNVQIHDTSFEYILLCILEYGRLMYSSLRVSNIDSFANSVMITSIGVK
jgi:hypothetical protein